ncbi:hypothetical protein [Pseudoruegeria sp. HB172150]|uniref:hypothetical protein n=1 Tax=Pseudoruegeria sp. HB172150 TaxID=2721164 RepID=UPI0015530EE2|nr:hypothetical protein [Pseudoruegeria sp. HB172150]
MSQPILKILSGPSPTQTAAAETTVLGLSSVVSAFSRAVDRYPHDQEGLQHFLQFKIATATQAQKRSRWFPGRIYNRFSGEDPDYIPLSGTHLIQTLKLAGILPPDFITASGRYELRLDYAQKALSALTEEINARPAKDTTEPPTAAE